MMQVPIKVHSNFCGGGYLLLLLYWHREGFPNKIGMKELRKSVINDSLLLNASMAP